MNIGTSLHTLLFGRRVGKDIFGNIYYETRRARAGKRTRWVMYKGLAEPSKVPAEWHGWLHYTLDLPPTERRIPVYTWAKEHLPNLTGTRLAYRPPGHLLKGGERAPTTADYTAWKP